MSKRLLGIGLVMAALISLGIGMAWAQDENYDGENYCRYAPAWPNGTYLGQMHPYHSEFYTRYAERRGWDPCQTWADDQRASAIRGLRKLGYAVYKPTPQPEPTPAPAQPPVVTTPAPTPAATPVAETDQDAEPVDYQEIRGWNSGRGVLQLPVGSHSVRMEFGGWNKGRVSVSYTTPEGNSVVVLDNANTAYARSITISVSVAGPFSFSVQAPNDWIISVGKRPPPTGSEAGTESLSRSAAPRGDVQCSFDPWEEYPTYFYRSGHCTVQGQRLLVSGFISKSDDVTETGYYVTWAWVETGIVIGRYFYPYS